jgi:hypothetical protein
MVPEFVDSLKRTWRDAVAALQGWMAAVRAQRWLLLSVVAVWMLALLHPAVAAYPRHGLHRGPVWLLLVLPPLASIATAAWRQPWLTWSVGLGGCLPALVACPPLSGSATQSPWSSLLLALAMLASLDATLRLSGAPGWLQQLSALPWTRRITLHTALGLAWLAIAWWGPTTPADEAARAARVLTAGVSWASLHLTPRPRPRRTLAHVLVRRGAWLALLAVLLWRWHHSA